MSLFADITCYPPLGQVTYVRRIQKARSSEADDTLHFTVVLESSSTFPDRPWEVQIWHNIKADSTSESTSEISGESGSEWKALPLRKCPSTVAPLLAGCGKGYKFDRHVFAESISLPASGGSAQFTVRFRTSPNAEWQWANQKRQVNDGELVWAARKPRFDEIKTSTEPSATSSPKDEFGRYFSSLSSDIEIEARTSEAPGSLLWNLTGNVDEAKEGQSGIANVTLGVPESVVKYFSLVRVWSPWLAPRHGKSKFRLTEPAILCSFLRTDGEHLVLLAVSGIDNVLTLFKSGENGELVIESKSDNPESSKFRVLAAAAADFEVAMSAVIYEARKLVKPPGSEEAPEKPESPTIPAGASPTGDDVVLVEKDPKIQWLSEWYDGLTYCTWNGLGRELTEERLIHALDTLKAHGINIVNLIIDDNWQTLDHPGETQFRRGWKQFEANPEGFPRGLKGTVEAIRNSQPSIEYIAVWHALLGYWGGISPDGDLATRYKTKQVTVKDEVAGGTILAVDPEDAHRFYDEFYSYLTSVGIDAVKTDAQFFLDLLEDPEDRRRFTEAYQDAWTVASLRHFSARSISCMSMIPQAIFHSQLPNNKPNILLRNSDDFFPDVAASHPWHVFCNAHNSLLTRFLNVTPDWDMFQTSHPYSSFHAAARCVSGGPIYITDEPGKHDLDIINQMTAPTTRGNTVVLRPSVVGRTLDVYHDYNEGHVLRVGSYTGWAKTGSGIIGLFNIHPSEASCIVSLLDFPGIHPDSDGRYIVRAHTSGKITERMRPSDDNSLVSVRLEQKGWEILTAYPTRAFTLKGSRGCNPKDGMTHVAILGLLGKMTGAAALVSSDIFLVENGRLRFDISLKALGTLGIYFSDLQDRTIAKNFMVMISGRAVPRKTVWKEGGEDAKVLAVDVQSAWKALGLRNGWSNEILVQVLVG